MKRIVYFLFLSFLILVRPSDASAQTAIRIGLVSATFGHAPFFVAKEKGFYKQEGLDTETIVMNRDDLILQALVSDSIQFGVITPVLLFNVRQRGLTDVKYIAGAFNGTTYSLIALPKYTKLEDLKGARLAVSSPVSGSTQMMKYVLKRRGLIYPRDYSLFSVGGSTSRWVALQTKEVDAAVLAEPLSTIAVQQGFNNLGDAYKLLPDYQLSGVAIKEEWARKNRGVVVRFLKALVSSFRWLHERRDEAIAILPKITNLKPQYIPGSWETYTKYQIWPENGNVNPKGLQTVIEIMHEEGILKKPLPDPKDIMDSSYLEEALAALR
jgi:ABC-type nitrate/sulfonate/bicarbonate transport system substrate-binding protein